jgi:hypothetical protein
MPTHLNRNKVVAVIGFIVFLYVLFHHSSSDSGFRQKTEAGLTMKEHLAKQGKEYLSDAELTAQSSKKLEDILEKQRLGLATGTVAEDRQSITAGDTESLSSALKSIAKGKETQYEDISIGGRKIMQKPKEIGKEQPKYPTNPEVGAGEEKAYNGAKVEKAVDMGREAARVDLQKILKRSPSEFPPNVRPMKPD